MKALLSKTPGGPDTLVVDELPSPQPGPTQVLVGGEYQPYVLSDVILSASQQVVYLGAVFVSGAMRVTNRMASSVFIVRTSGGGRVGDCGGRRRR